jgi:hypothetical protein
MAQALLVEIPEVRGGGKAEIEIEATKVRELLARLGEAYPGLAPQIKRGVSVSIDGKIYAESWFQPIGPESEVCLLPRLVGDEGGADACASGGLRFPAYNWTG